MQQIEKGLDAAEDAEFNDKHPRAAAGAGGLRPGQFAPKSEAEKLRDEEADAAEEAAAEEADSPPPADSTTVTLGDNEDSAREAVADTHAANLRKSTGEGHATPQLIVVFGDRADATKFAIACDAVMGNDAAMRVTAAANGKYHVEPAGLTAAEIDRIQEMVHRQVPLSEMSLEKDQEPMDKEEGTLEKSASDYLRKSIASGAVSADNLDQVLAIARTIATFPEMVEAQPGFLAVAEAIHYGSVQGLVQQASAAGDREFQERAGQIIKGLCDAHLAKGATMDRKLLLLPVNEQPPVAKTKHASTENDGKALPLGTKERVTAKVGDEENITEKTARYPRTGHKQARRPKLILNR